MCATVPGKVLGKVPRQVLGKVLRGRDVQDQVPERFRKIFKAASDFVPVENVSPIKMVVFQCHVSFQGGTTFFNMTFIVHSTRTKKVHTTDDGFHTQNELTL